MILKRIKSKVVAHISYFVGSEGEATVVDPRRDCQIYADIAMQEGMTIKYIFETHRNEDYVIGSQELAHLTGAEIYHGPGLDFKYGNTLENGQEFYFGKLKIKAIHTPGHTPESTSYALIDLDSGEKTVMVFTGDTLFVNDVGRTDFGGPKKARKWTEDIYESIFDKLLPLGDWVMLWPAHGSGSVCGGAIADREYSTLGIERLMNPLLRKTKKEFIDHMINEKHERAPYFKMMEKFNLEGAPFVGCGPNLPALSIREFKRQKENGAVVVDARSPVSFGGGHVKGSYSLPLKRLGMGGWVLPYDKPILLILEDQKHLDYVARSLIRLGYDNISGYLEGGVASWYKATLPLESLGLLTVTELKEALDKGEDWLLLDVRSEREWLEGHIDGTLNIYAGTLENHLNEVSYGKPVVVICKTGTRSSFAGSILLIAEHKEVYNLLGGMDAWQKAIIR
jgi:hydroxyacylglutathione hydrolase